MPKFDWDISPILFHYPSWLSFLPGDGIRYYSLLYVGVFLGGYRLLDWQIRRAGGSEDDANDFVLYGVIAVLAGSRLGHVFFYDFEKFKQDPMWTFRIWEGGLASHGGMLGLTLAMWIFTKFRRQSFVEGSDRFAFSAGLGSTLIRIGNFFNSEIVGRVTDQTWGVRFLRYDDQYRHPSQLYEVVLGLLVMGTLWVADRLAGQEKRPRGLLISIFFAEYFTGRFFVEYFKEYQTLQPGESFMSLTEGQWLSIIPALVGYVGLFMALKKRIPAKWNVYGVPPTPPANGADDDADADVDDVLLDKR